MKTYVISKKDTEKILKTIVNGWNNKISIPKTKNIKAFEIEEYKSILVIDSLVAVFVSDEIVLPFLGRTEVLEKFPSVIVDSGSIKFICNGAKILRPGIVEFTQFNRNDIVVVKEEKYGKYLSVGIALEDSVNAKELQKGQIINNLHYVGDKFWNAFKEISFRI
ncbi:MAG TPA: PUA domain-containing protein [Candidatus Nitrosocosmicus sp.]|nr:PUA domain-containing protein [Candidatus Nitrosocosmicus sp.]